MKQSVLSFRDFSRGLPVRFVLFAFLGMGWDVLMTTVQQVIAGTIDIHASNPASTWMYLAYGGIAVFFYPLMTVLRSRGVSYALRILAALMVFYAIEWCYGAVLLAAGIRPWNYDWFLDPRWTYRGIITWHPVIVGFWGLFIVLADFLDALVRSRYAELAEAAREFWRTIEQRPGRVDGAQ